MNIYTYTAFKDEFAARFLNELPAPYCNGKVRIEKIGKNNGMREAVCVVTSEPVPCPVTYLDEAFNMYLGNNDMDATVEEMVHEFMGGIEYLNFIGGKFLNPQTSDIVYVLVNAEKNKDLLEKVPHRMFLNLALIYRFLIVIGPEQNIHSAVVQNGYMESMGYTEEDLFEIARKNTQERFPLVSKHVVGDFIALTNEYCMFGATALVYDGALKDIAEEVKGDFFIIPSSIHEVFIMPDHGQDVEELCQVIAQANNDVCEKDEILGERPYRYIYETDEIEVL